jgi:chorismate synthase
MGIGGVIDGCPAGIPLCEADMQRELDARRPGTGGRGGSAGTARNEADAVRLLSGVYQGKTTGTPIAFHVDNTDQRSGDYSPLEEVLRPGHADLGFHAKYGLRDPRGGGRASGRETIGRVAAGAVAQKLLAANGIVVRAFTLEFGGIRAPLADPSGAGDRAFFAPDDAVVSLWEERIRAVKKEGNTLGGLVRVEAFGLPPGLGEPVFDKLDARLAFALMGVGAVKGVEIGRGFESARLTGSQNNDPFLTAPGHSRDSGDEIILGGSVPPVSGGLLPCGAGYALASNNAGGILGGMSNGAPLEATVAVKPISSIAKEQRTITLTGEPTAIAIAGRHDISAIPRIVPVLKAMTALTLADFLLLQRVARL